MRQPLEEVECYFETNQVHCTVAAPAADEPVAIPVLPGYGKIAKRSNALAEALAELLEASRLCSFENTWHAVSHLLTRGFMRDG